LVLRATFVIPKDISVSTKYFIPLVQWRQLELSDAVVSYYRHRLIFYNFEVLFEVPALLVKVSGVCEESRREEDIPN